MTRRLVVKLPQTEGAFQAAVISAMRVFGWRVAHFRPAKTEKGWRTPVEADGAGFPDLIALRGARMIVAELKVGDRMPTVEQEAWVGAFETLGSSIYDAIDRTADDKIKVDVAVWTPDDWPAIEALIR